MLGLENHHGTSAPATADSASGQSLPARMEQYEADIIRKTLTDHAGDIRQTIEALGIPRKTFYDKLQRHGIVRGDFSK